MFKSIASLEEFLFHVLKSIFIRVLTENLFGVKLPLYMILQIYNQNKIDFFV